MIEFTGTHRTNFFCDEPLVAIRLSIRSIVASCASFPETGVLTGRVSNLSIRARVRLEACHQRPLNYGYMPAKKSEVKKKRGKWKRNLRNFIAYFKCTMALVQSLVVRPEQRAGLFEMLPACLTLDLKCLQHNFHQQVHS